MHEIYNKRWPRQKLVCLFPGCGCYLHRTTGNNQEWVGVVPVTITDVKDPGNGKTGKCGQLQPNSCLMNISAGVGLLTVIRNYLNQAEILFEPSRDIMICNAIS